MAQAIQRQTATARRGMGRGARREAITGYLFAAPWIIGFIVFTGGPMLYSIYTSFTQYNVIAAPKWIGTRNYTRLFADPNFYDSLANTLWMVVVKTPLVIVASIVIALLLNINMPGAKTFRTIFYLPNVLAGVAAVFLWRWILAPEGLFNQGLGVFGLAGPAWFADPQWTKPGLVVMGMWWIGGNVLIYLASLKGIPRSMYEAAEIDGATGLKSTWFITLPLLSPTIFFQIVTGIIGAFQIFSTALIIIPSDSPNKGGPGNSLLFYVLYLYNRAFGRTGAGGFQMGYAAAMAWVLFIIILAITLFQLWAARRWVHYETE